MDKLYSAEQIADYFIHKAHSEGRTITNKKLQKIIYYAQAWSLVVRKKPLFEDDIEAWIHGPVVGRIYRKYKGYGFNNISETPKSVLKAPKSLEAFLDNIWLVYGERDADYLEALTHNEEPWQIAREGIDAKINSSNVISHESMIAYYSNLLKKSNKN